MTGEMTKEGHTQEMWCCWTGSVRLGSQSMAEIRLLSSQFTANFRKVHIQ